MFFSRLCAPSAAIRKRRRDRNTILINYHGVQMSLYKVCYGMPPPLPSCLIFIAKSDRNRTNGHLQGLRSSLFWNEKNSLFSQRRAGTRYQFWNFKRKHNYQKQYRNRTFQVTEFEKVTRFSIRPRFGP